MEEKRRHKRLDLDVRIELERLDEDGVTTLKFVHVDVVDISRSGIGFKAPKALDVGSYYDTRIQIWTKEIVDAVVQTVAANKASSQEASRQTPSSPLTIGVVRRSSAYKPS